MCIKKKLNQTACSFKCGEGDIWRIFVYFVQINNFVTSAVTKIKMSFCCPCLLCDCVEMDVTGRLVALLRWVLTFRLLLKSQGHQVSHGALHWLQATGSTSSRGLLLLEDFYQ